MGVWQSETSTLIHDPGAPAGERWKVLWFQYLNANLTPYFFDYSWLAMKAAATPEGLATATPVKLFAGFGLQDDGETTVAPVFSPLGGPPAIHLDSDLTQVVYLATFCGDPITTDKYIVGFRCAAPCSMTSATSWEYLGRVLTPTDAANATGHAHVQAPAFVEQAGKVYLVASYCIPMARIEVLHVVRT